MGHDSSALPKFLGIDIVRTWGRSIWVKQKSPNKVLRTSITKKVKSRLARSDCEGCGSKKYPDETLCP